MSTLDLYDAKTWLNISESSDEDKIQATIDAAETAIGARVGPLASTTVTRRVRSCDGSLVLPVMPAASLTSVTYVGGSVVTLGDIYLDTAIGVATYSQQTRGFVPGLYTVVYTAGYAALPGGTPDDLLLAVKELVRHLWRTQRGSGTARPGTVAPETLANTLTAGAYIFPIRVEQLIAPYQTLCA